MLYKLLEVYFEPNDGDKITQLEKTMKEVMRANLTDRNRGSVMKLLNTAFLDPRFKALSFLLDVDKLDIIVSVEAEVAVLVQSIVSQESEFSSSAEYDSSNIQRDAK